MEQDLTSFLDQIFRRSSALFLLLADMIFEKSLTFALVVSQAIGGIIPTLKKSSMSWTA